MELTPHKLGVDGGRFADTEVAVYGGGLEVGEAVTDVDGPASARDTLSAVLKVGAYRYACARARLTLEYHGIDGHMRWVIVVNGHGGDVAVLGP